jgi:hypothetical protein
MTIPGGSAADVAVETAHREGMKQINNNFSLKIMLLQKRVWQYTDATDNEPLL